jgi:predicted RNase H-like HicB family nuclease
MKKRAILQYDFNCECWVAEFKDIDCGPLAHGDTPQEAIENLKRECNKHDLWEHE